MQGRLSTIGDLEPGTITPQVRVRTHTLSLQQGASVLATNLDGEIDGENAHGLYEKETRYLSRYTWSINRHPLIPVSVQPITHNALLGYYLAPPQSAIPESTLDIKLSRVVGDGMHEDIWLINQGTTMLQFELILDVEVDFSDINELYAKERRQLGRFNRGWNPTTQTMDFTYEVEDLKFNLEIMFSGPLTAQYRNSHLVWTLNLDPKQCIHLCAKCAPTYCGRTFQPPSTCFPENILENDKQALRSAWLNSSTQLLTPNRSVQSAYNVAKSDLITMRLWDEDTGRDAWIPAAGQPGYLGIFGRDILTTGWQTGLMGSDMMKGSLGILRRYQGKDINDWRDEQPGKILHEARFGPLSLLDKIPQHRYYGSTTSTPLFIVVLSELYHWTGDIRILEDYREAMESCLEWIDQYGDLDRDGLYEYQTRSSQGLRNQGWKDSENGIVYADGSLVPTPIATCEEQGWVYEAKVRASMIYTALKSFRRAERLLDEARQLKEQFNQAFWMNEENFYALALDPDKRPVTSVTSNPGHCLATGIVDEERAGPTIGRLLSPDLFSGWGIRTLSSRHPHYNPYTYHLGSVWPVENGTFCMGFVRYGFYEHANVLAEGMFSASRYFEHHRLPEAISGHPRDAHHPFPSIYPHANAPQAWSSSSIPMMIQAMLWLYPFAPLKLLFLKPHLPEWLPELTLNNLQVGNATVSLHIWREEDGHSRYRVLDQTGTLRILPRWISIHRFHQLLNWSEDHLTELAL